MQNFKKTFIKVYSGQAFSIVSSSVVQFALIWYITLQTKSGLYVSLATLAAFLPQGIIGIYAGSVVDKYNRKNIMIYADMFVAIMSLLLLILSNIYTLSIPMILIFLMLRSIGTAFHEPALQASVPLIVPTEKLLKYNSYVNMINSTSNIISPMIASFLLAVANINFIIAFDILGAIIAISMIKISDIPNVVHEHFKKESYIDSMKQGLSIVKNNKVLKVIFINGLCFTILYMPITSLFPLLINQQFLKDESGIAIVQASYGIGMLLGAIVVTKLKIFRILLRNLSIATILISISLFISYFLNVDQFYIFIVVCLLLGMGAPIINTSVVTMIAKNVNKEYLGRIYANLSTITIIVMPIGLLISGNVADIIGVSNWYLISSILFLGLVIFQYTAYKIISKDKTSKIYK
ncbi:MFS transporter [Mycoplasma sp. P36-A1]|uniref:MFS transporter n=1 Tax=Mycoplasma sp. P36-A1 TaxID=3252900 RepID=UPI003C3034DC